MSFYLGTFSITRNGHTKLIGSLQFFPLATTPTAGGMVAILPNNHVERNFNYTLIPDTTGKSTLTITISGDPLLLAGDGNEDASYTTMTATGIRVASDGSFTVPSGQGSIGPNGNGSDTWGASGTYTFTLATFQITRGNQNAKLHGSIQITPSDGAPTTGGSIRFIPNDHPSQQFAYTLTPGGNGTSRFDVVFSSNALLLSGNGNNEVTYTEMFATGITVGPNGKFTVSAGSMVSRQSTDSWAATGSFTFSLGTFQTTRDGKSTLHGPVQFTPDDLAPLSGGSVRFVPHKHSSQQFTYTLASLASGTGMRLTINLSASDKLVLSGDGGEKDIHYHLMSGKTSAVLDDGSFAVPDPTQTLMEADEHLTSAVTWSVSGKRSFTLRSFQVTRGQHTKSHGSIQFTPSDSAPMTGGSVLFIPLDHAGQEFTYSLKPEAKGAMQLTINLAQTHTLDLSGNSRDDVYYYVMIGTVSTVRSDGSFDKVINGSMEAGAMHDPPDTWDASATSGDGQEQHHRHHHRHHAAKA